MIIMILLNGAVVALTLHFIIFIFNPVLLFVNVVLITSLNAYDCY